LPCNKARAQNRAARTRHFEPTDPRDVARSDDRLREAIQGSLQWLPGRSWIASSLSLLAMTMRRAKEIALSIYADDRSGFLLSLQLRGKRKSAAAAAGAAYADEEALLLLLGKVGTRQHGAGLLREQLMQREIARHDPGIGRERGVLGRRLRLLGFSRRLRFLRLCHHVFRFVMRGLDPRIHADHRRVRIGRDSYHTASPYGWPGQARP
jgi:hypothetical protein